MPTLLRPIFNAMIPEKIQSSTFEEQRQYTVLVSIILISTLFLIILGVITFFQHETLLSLLDFGIATIFISLGIFLKGTSKLREVGTVVISLLAIFFYYLFYYNGLERSTWVWYYTFPLWSIFVLGKKPGTAIAFFLMAITLMTHLFMVRTGLESTFSTNMMIRFILSYSCVTFVTFIMEDTRIAIYTKLLNTNTELNNTIEELKDAKGQLHKLTTRDAVTGFYNERHFKEILSLSLAHANRYNGQMALSIIEVDYCSNFQTRYGEDALNDLYKKIALIIQPITAHDSDTVCKLEGGRFAVIFNNVNADLIEQIAHKIHKSIEAAKINHDKSPLKIATVSVGSIIIPAEHTTMESSRIFSLALAILDRTSQNGKNCVTTSLFNE